MSDVRVVARGGVPLCAVCKEPGDLTACPGCYSGYHGECVVGGRCPSIGCVNADGPKQKKVQCENCKGTGKEIVNEMCRAHVYDCNRCDAKGFKLVAFDFVADPACPTAYPKFAYEDRSAQEEALRHEVARLREEVERRHEQTAYMFKVGITFAIMVLVLVFSNAFQAVVRVLGGQ